MEEKENSNQGAFLWHAALLAITVTFTDVNTVLPALILKVGGGEVHIGILTAIMAGVPLAGQLFFAGFLHTRPRKKPFLLLGINMRVLALAGVTVTLGAAWSHPGGWLFPVIFGQLFLFTLSGAFAGVSYIDLVGKSIPRPGRHRFFLRKQLISSLGILLSALLTRWILKGLPEPKNSQLLFGSAAAVLLLASAGFWMVREKPRESAGDRGLSVGRIFRSVPSILKGDANLRLYIIVANLLGLGTTFIPFYIALARLRYGLDPRMIGNILLLQIGGMVLSNLLWRWVVKHRGFKGVLLFQALMGIVLPLAAWSLSRYLPLAFYLPLFLVSGAAVGAQKIAAEAVLVEISHDKNRALYSGIYGAMSLTVVIFPLLQGWLLGRIGYFFVCLGVSLAALAALPFIGRMVCPVDPGWKDPLEEGPGEV